MRRECWERFPRHRFQKKPLVSDPDMHHGTYVTHVPWYMSGSLTRGGGRNVPGIPGACATRKFTYLTRGPLPQCQWSDPKGSVSISWFHDVIACISLEIYWIYSTSNMSPAGAARVAAFAPGPDVTNYQAIVSDGVITAGLIFVTLGALDERKRNLYMPGFPIGLALSLGIISGVRISFDAHFDMTIPPYLHKNPIVGIKNPSTILSA